MTQRIAALTGISGVGKSTLLRALAARVEFVPLQASALIRKARESLIEQAVIHDQLRYANLDENQQLLIQGFKASAAKETPLVVLDGHTVIERDDDYVLIDPAVFGAIGIHVMIFLRVDPAAIDDRRAKDRKRTRPKKDINALAHIQAIALSHAEHICEALHVPLHVTTGDTDLVSDILRCLRDAIPA